MHYATLLAISSFQRMIIKRSMVLVREIERAARDSRRNQALDRCEQLLIRNGGRLLRDCLEGALYFERIRKEADLSEDEDFGDARSGIRRSLDNVDNLKRIQLRWGI
jgi:hypothetical protein